MYCRDCKFWTGINSVDFATCRKVETTYDGKIHSSGFPTKAAAVPFDPMTGRFPVKGIYGTLETAPDFGCVQFEAKEDNGQV